MSIPKVSVIKSLMIFMALSVSAAALAGVVWAQNLTEFTPRDAMKIERSYYARISPNGEWIAYIVYSGREPDDEPGGGYTELYLVSTRTGDTHPFITGKVNISSPVFSPDGSHIAFLMKRGEGSKRQVWAIPVDGGESMPVTSSDTGVPLFRWHPSGEKIAFVATEPESETEETLEDKGYDFIYFEENLKHRDIYIVPFKYEDPPAEAHRITRDKVVWDFQFSPDGETIAAMISPKNLVDHRYMFKDIYLVDAESGDTGQLTTHEGKMGNFMFSPDGSKIAYAASLNLKDHAVSQAYVIETDGDKPKNLTEPDFRGHITRVGWKDDDTIIYEAAEGVWNNIYAIESDGDDRKKILDGERMGLVIGSYDHTGDSKHFALVCQSPRIPGDIFYWKEGSGDPKRLTELNPWISERNLGRQEVVRYTARDGLEIEGILVYPAGYENGERYPLVMGIHGGPESHYTNGWIGSYFNPAQVLASRGYVVFYPNYRASTGYGVEFGMQGYMDAAGKEFDDLADGIEFLVDRGIADPERVGMGGGSYGGYASAWFGTYYTDYVRAVCVFVGISDLVSKRSTTDIPYEELYVHSGKLLDESWEMWEYSIKRSPVYYANRSETAVLILGGTADPRVHPGQSLELYRRLKMNKHPAVRMVRYPGEGHGNRKQPGRIDVLYRHLQWYDWYVKEARPLDGPMPDLILDEHYGLESEEDSD